MLEDPRVNFAISHNKCGTAVGINHLGLQVDSEAELTALESRFADAGLPGVQEHGASCCYAKSDKTWLQDPQGIAWENFHTLGSVPVFGGSGPELLRAGGSCQPSATQTSCGSSKPPAPTRSRVEIRAVCGSFPTKHTLWFSGVARRYRERRSQAGVFPTSTGRRRLSAASR